MARQRLGQHFLERPGLAETHSRHAAARLRRCVDRNRRGPRRNDAPSGRDGTPRHCHRNRPAAGRNASGERAGAIPDEWPGVEIVPGDVLTLDLAKLAGSDTFRVYGNLPYYITSPILHHLFDFADRIASIHVVIQYEVAARIAARPGRREYGYLSAACQFYSRPEIVLRIPPGAFRPPPQVTFALVRNDAARRARIALELPTTSVSLNSCRPASGKNAKRFETICAPSPPTTAFAKRSEQRRSPPGRPRRAALARAVRRLFAAIN